MITVKQIQFDVAELNQLLSTLHGYIYTVLSQEQDLLREDMYRLGLLKTFNDRLTKRLESMIVNGRKSTKVKFDSVHAVLMVDVLQRTMASKVTQEVLFHLGSMCPPQMQKV